MLKITGNYFLGIFLYTLVIILLADFGRILLKYVFHASWIHSRTAFTVAGAICALLILLLSACGIFHAKYIKTTSYDVIINKTIPERTSMKVVLLADTHFGYNAGVLHARELVRKINKQKPDLVCIAGDIFDNEYDAIRNPEKLEKTLRGIKSTYGVYACWGNHDLNEEILAGFTFKHKDGDLSDIKDPRMKKFLEDSNIHILEDESVLIFLLHIVADEQREIQSRCTILRGAFFYCFNNDLIFTLGNQVKAADRIVICCKSHIICLPFFNKF